MSEATKKPAAPAAGRASTKKELPEHFKAYKHVWVFVEQERGQVHHAVRFIPYRGSL
jgi:electron transfer flavoprotein alpha subunit